MAGKAWLVRQLGGEPAPTRSLEQHRPNPESALSRSYYEIYPQFTRVGPLLFWAGQYHFLAPKYTS